MDSSNEIRIQPLSKFPVIRDLIINRNEMFEVMKEMKLWISGTAKVNEDIHSEYEVSQCLMCGCCLEACPNYRRGELFAGAPVAVAASKVIVQEKEEAQVQQLRKNYKKRFYNGCVKSLACQKVCPMEIPTDMVISKMNRLSVWGIWKLFSK